jgi:hypothetical protein
MPQLQLTRSVELLSLEDVPEVTSACGAHNLGTLHAPGLVRVAGDCAGDGVEECRPTAAALQTSG